MRTTYGATMVATLIVLAGGSAGAQEVAGAAKVAGVYELTEVNGQSLPAPAWHRASADSTCVTVQHTGSLSLDAHGRWAATMSERDRCNMSFGRRLVKPDVATMFAGRFKVDGSAIELVDDMLGGGTLVGTVAGGTIVLDAPGVGELTGQRATYTLKRVREARGY